MQARLKGFKGQQAAAIALLGNFFIKVGCFCDCLSHQCSLIHNRPHFVVDAVGSLEHLVGCSGSETG